ncbi:MAG: hypothetical protein PF636_10160 [Actinomycetota bacterium]|jgi:hypothetical protein|nr:hypothetical protein [Actinomycetota bacterium]
MAVTKARIVWMDEDKEDTIVAVTAGDKMRGKRDLGKDADQGDSFAHMVFLAAKRNSIAGAENVEGRDAEYDWYDQIAEIDLVIPDEVEDEGEGTATPAS